MAHTNTWNKNGLFRKLTGKISPEKIFAINKGHTKIYTSTDDMISSAKGNLKIAIITIKGEHIALANNYREEMKNKLFKCKIF